MSVLFLKLDFLDNVLISLESLFHRDTTRLAKQPALRNVRELGLKSFLKCPISDEGVQRPKHLLLGLL